MRAFALSISALAAVFAAPTYAQDSAATPPKPVKQKKICRRQEITGSIMATSICHSASEWDDIDQKNTRGVDDARSRRGGATSAN